MSETGKTQFCPQCGAPRMEGANFCAKCGHRFAAAPIQDDTVIQAPGLNAGPVPLPAEAAGPLPAPAQMPPSFVPQTQAESVPHTAEDLGETEILPPQRFGGPKPGAVRPGAVHEGTAQPVSIQPEHNSRTAATGTGGSSAPITPAAQPNPGAFQIAPETGDIAPWGVTAEEREAAQEAAKEAAREAAREAVPGAEPQHGRHTPFIAAQPVYEAQPLESLVARTEAIAAARAEEEAREQAEEAQEPAQAESSGNSADAPSLSPTKSDSPLPQKEHAAKETTGESEASSVGEATTAFDPLAALAEEEAAATGAGQADQTEAGAGVQSSPSPTLPDGASSREEHKEKEPEASSVGEETVAFNPLAALAEEEAADASAHGLHAQPGEHPAPNPAPNADDVDTPAHVPESEHGTGTPSPSPATSGNALSQEEHVTTVNNTSATTSIGEETTAFDPLAALEDEDDRTVLSPPQIDDDTVPSASEIDDRTVISDPTRADAIETATGNEPDPVREAEETTAFNPLEWFDDTAENDAQPGIAVLGETAPTSLNTVAVPAKASVPQASEEQAAQAIPTGPAMPPAIPPTTALPQNTAEPSGGQETVAMAPVPSPTATTNNPMANTTHPEEQATQAIPVKQMKTLLAGAGVAGIVGTAAAAHPTAAAASETTTPASATGPASESATVPSSAETTVIKPSAVTHDADIPHTTALPLSNTTGGKDTPAAVPTSSTTAPEETIAMTPLTTPATPSAPSATPAPENQPVRTARSASSTAEPTVQDPSQPTVQSSTRPSILAPVTPAQSAPQSALDELAQFAVPDDEDDEVPFLGKVDDKTVVDQTMAYQQPVASATSSATSETMAMPSAFAPNGQQTSYGQFGQPGQPDGAYGTNTYGDNAAYGNQYGGSTAPTPTTTGGYGNGSIPGGSTPNVPGTPNGPGSGQVPGGPIGNAPAPKPKRRHTGAIVAAVICVIALVAAAGGYALWRNREHQAAVSACTEAQSSFDKSATTLSNSITKGKQAISDTQYDEVSDQTAITSLNNLVNTSTDDGSSESCSVDRTTAQLNASADKFKSLAKSNVTLASKIDNGVTTLKGSKASKTLADAKSTLESTLSKAKELMTSATGNVTDETVLTALQQAISDASTLMQSLTDADSSKVTASALNKASDTLETAMEKVNASVKAKQAADDKTRCQNIAGNYGMWQGSMQLTVSADCSISMQDAGEASGSSGAYSYTADSYKENGDGTVTWSLSNNETMTYYPAGKEAPSIKQFIDALGNGETDPTVNLPKIETGDGSAYVG
ncbi:zinc ribbon domain-containing protein [Bifidobacterium callimiconis]|uniref:Sugar-binding domain-containing protein n=1 Tax=Bifidobacterium callimiconis TaxID=2306973 RepID=A0A430FB65_9BIFI|nr:hypothetical protein [Bifidobacterium callimiconis]RSX50038.1 sugar-binding domain-containing protein [Bifidobacterium callimiconis]